MAGGARWTGTLRACHTLQAPSVPSDARVRAPATGNRSSSASDDSAALNDPDQQHGDGHHQQEVDKATERIGTDESQEPQDDENQKECPEHLDLPLEIDRLTPPNGCPCSVRLAAAETSVCSIVDNQS